MSGSGSPCNKAGLSSKGHKQGPCQQGMGHPTSTGLVLHWPYGKNDTPSLHAKPTWRPQTFEPKPVTSDDNTPGTPGRHSLGVCTLGEGLEKPWQLTIFENFCRNESDQNIHQHIKQEKTGKTLWTKRRIPSIQVFWSLL